MNKEQFINRLSELYNRNLEISKIKNSDYAKTDDPFMNFKLVEYLGICSVETGMMVRICDKVARISNLLSKDPSVTNEKINDTLSDLSNYAGIMEIYLEQKNEQ